MGPNWLSVVIAGVVCLFGIGAHAVATAWWASKITTKLEIFGEELSALLKKHEADSKERYTKAEAREDCARHEAAHVAMWKKIDTLRDQVVIIQNDLSNVKRDDRGRG